MASERQDGGRPGRILAIAARSRRRLTSNPLARRFLHHDVSHRLCIEWFRNTTNDQILFARSYHPKRVRCEEETAVTGATWRKCLRARDLIARLAIDTGCPAAAISQPRSLSYILSNKAEKSRPAR